MLHLPQRIELLPTPFKQTAHGNLSHTLLSAPVPAVHLITFVLSIFTFSPFSSKPFFHNLNLAISSSSDSAIKARSSAYSNSHETPVLNSSDRASNTIMKSKGLNTDPWYTPTLIGNATLSPSPSLIAVDALSYIAWITLTSHSSTPNFLSAHQTTSRGTLSKAFSRSTKAIHISCFLVKNLSCICLTMKMASVVPRPGLKPNCILSICTLSLTLFSITRSRTCITWSNNLMPRYDPHSKALPLPLYTLTIQLFLQSCEIFPSVTTALHRSVMHCIPTSPAAFNISATTPLGPGAFPNLAFFIATFTSSKVIPSHSPGTLYTCSRFSFFQSNSSFSSSSKHSFHTFFIFASSITSFPCLSLTQFTPTTRDAPISYLPIIGRRLSMPNNRPSADYRLFSSPLERFSLH